MPQIGGATAHWHARSAPALDAARGRQAAGGKFARRTRRARIIPKWALRALSAPLELPALRCLRACRRFAQNKASKLERDLASQLDDANKAEAQAAKEAAEMGLINHAVPTKELDAKTDEITGKILANPRWAVRWTKTAVNLVLRDIANRVMDAAIAYEISSNATKDRQEAVTAFVEKRAPNFTGD